MTDMNAAAFPYPVLNSSKQPQGLTAREHAAIALRVPDSGMDWLDAMIRTSLRQEFAKAAMQAYAASSPDAFDPDAIVQMALRQADALLAELEKKA